ncbi:GntR family transcriptional regulator [Lactonifactor sp. BIOML-A3]|uniref:FadR/GntR family transcriptional regulator n=1 Tax=unclassified Lactonifactor TaxID=2636670 RepID=UPI0012B0BBA6|nr:MULTISPECIES: GntR family transcriptional regulator [unclassified Lactonifactor]MSA00303.1 GntR family transcriptional regulator [Lactonifactor sp. BIOML-A5]MSA07472.1 GntR family transcriptional regulator [Lactonifactor sp. BIOML-A4]MSA12234.1 GntR family transcriptional regulator [Lactonifactor sp. BIOML-A3]MSA16882.1 GntR family transcriptional regulator [Lactonifactor sp. BIOML-A2]MSA38605.1 GntR family transcriptional regulator [Lactonifactor sp. BIOML-A1]
MGKRYLSPINTKSMVQIVIDRISGAIIDGELRPGDKIPTEPELSAMFNVGRNTVREAIRILVAYGVLEIRRAEGTFVCDGFSPQIINPAIYQIILQKENSYDELIDLRKIIENGVMHLLMEKKVSQETWNKIGCKCDLLVKELEKETPDIAKVADADIDFHEEIAKATNNSLVLVVHDVIVQLTRESRYHTIERVIAKGDKQYLIYTHKNLVEKLQGDDINALYAAINDSYFYWKDIYR